MVDISNTAQAYFTRLIEQQDEPGLGLRLRVLNPSTPQADCELLFCSPDESAQDDEAMSFSDFTLYIPAASRQWLNGAQLDFEEDATGGALSIKAPDIKGHAPADDAPLADRVAWVINTEINSMVASHGGQVSLQEITDSGEVVLQFGGGCHGCSMVDVTLKNGVEKTLLSHFPELAGIIDATDHATGQNPYMS